MLLLCLLGGACKQQPRQPAREVRGGATPKKVTASCVTAAQLKQRHHGALYLLVASPKKGDFLVCTAFATGSQTLVTTADCVRKLLAHQRLGRAPHAMLNGHPKKRHRIVKMSANYTPLTVASGVANIRSLALGTLHTEQPLGARLTPATPAQQAGLKPRATVQVYGFELGQISTSRVPRATVVRGRFDDTFTWAGDGVERPDNTLLKLSAGCGEGSAGSPLLDCAGRVVGVVAGSYAPSRSKLYAKQIVVHSGKKARPFCFAIGIDALAP